MRTMRRILILLTVVLAACSSGGSLHKYHLKTKGGSFELQVVNHDWRSNKVGFELH